LIDRGAVPGNTVTSYDLVVLLSHSNGNPHFDRNQWRHYRGLMSWTNALLSALPETERRALAPYLTRVELKQHQILFDVRDTVSHLYFATDAVVSLVIPLSTGKVVETAMAGRDGIIGAAAALNGRVSLNRAIVQVGGFSLRCAVEPLKILLKEHAFIRSLIGAHEQALLGQAQQSAACNATHVIESRLARWLLRAADLHGANELPLTQEYIAQMLGVRRTSVTVVARTLQQAGLIFSMFRRSRKQRVNAITP
jgi:CRP-like cAMP-binding protein